EVAGDALDARQAAGLAALGAIVVGHHGPVGVTVHQHGQQAAVDQVRPAAVHRVGEVFGDHVDAVLVPAALDVQAVGVAAAAAVADAFRSGGVLQGEVLHVRLVVPRTGVPSLTAFAEKQNGPARPVAVTWKGSACLLPGRAGSAGTSGR